MTPDCLSVEVSSFNGAFIPSVNAADATKVPLSKGIFAKNMQYFGDSAGTRYGHSVALSSGQPISAMVNWTFVTAAGVPKNYLAWFTPGVGVRIADLSTLTITTACVQITAVTASIQPLGSRLYCGFMDANGIGIAAGQVYDYAAAAADPLFAPPITTTPTFSEVGSGVTTPGAKLFGYLIQTRTGFITRPSPAPGDNFAGVSYTSTGGIIDVSIDPPAHAWPDYALNVALIMTTTANPAQFYIVPSTYPGNSPFVPVSRVAVTHVFVNCTDDYLTTSGQDATPYLTQLSQTVTGAAPLSPSVIYAYGQRMAYICQDASGIPVTYYSDSSLPQNLNAGTSGVYLPGQRTQTDGCSIRQTSYTFGPSWTYSVTDSNGVPATWAEPQLIDGTIGSAGPFCVSLSSRQDYAWVGGESGLYRLDGGGYPDRPISYWQRKDWQRINFAAPTKIQVIDNKGNQQVQVLAPLDGATSPTHILTWDYSIGTDPDLVQYSIKEIADYSLGAVALVQSQATKVVEVWYGPSDAGDVIRQNDGSEAQPWRDVNSAIESKYETALLPPGAQGRLIFHHGDRYRITGEGTASIVLWSLDHSARFPESVGDPLLDIELNPEPGQEIIQRYFLLSEFTSTEITTDGLDEWFRISNLVHFYTYGMPQR